MDKLLFFRYSATDSFAAPASNLIRMVGSIDGIDQVSLYFDSFSRKGDPQAIYLTCSDKKKAIEDINNSIKNSREPIVVVADNVTSSYISSGITEQQLTSANLYVNPE